MFDWTALKFRQCLKIELNSIRIKCKIGNCPNINATNRHIQLGNKRPGSLKILSVAFGTIKFFFNIRLDTHRNLNIKKYILSASAELNPLCLKL